jgi:hypothetical protein
MKKIILFTGFFCLTSIAFHLHAQSINNSNWKAFFRDPFNDTLIIHIHGDSSFVTNSSGEVLVRSNYTIAGDTLAISDYSTGEYACPDMKGKYKINLKADNLILTLIDDPCEGRAQALDGVKWAKASK